MGRLTIKNIETTQKAFMYELIKNPIDITSYILKFRDFLNISYPYVDTIMCDDDLGDEGISIIRHWTLNWEFLVKEILLNQTDILPPYLSHSSIFTTKSSEENTHVVLCKVEQDKAPIEYTKNKAIAPATKDGWFLFRTLIAHNNSHYPPFGFVGVITLDGKKYYKFPLDKCTFFLSKTVETS